MNFQAADLPGLVVIEPRIFEDERGFFMETYNKRRFVEAGIPAEFVQDNHSASVRGTLRGLHFQIQQPQGKLVRSVNGVVFDVAVDLRRYSATFGKWLGFELSASNRRQVYIPPGFAHGFCVLSETAEVVYKCTDFYSPEHERTLQWNDPQLAIAWPLVDPILSPKDRNGRPLSEIPVFES